MTAALPKLGYVISRYPFVTHTFIQREVRGLREAGYEVETLAVVAAGEEHIRSDVDREEAARTMNLRPLRVGAVVRHLVGPALRNPGAVLRTLRLSASGWWSDPRQLLWRFFYALEAIMAWSMLAERDVDHLHAHHANVAANIAWLASEFGRHVGRGPMSWTFTMHGPAELIDLERSELGKKAEAAAGVACISDFTRSQVMMAISEASWDRLTVVHCGVSLDDFRPPDPPRPERPFTVLFVGRLDAEKGIPVLLDAFAELTRLRHPEPVKLIVVGGGEWREEGERRSEALGLDVEFAGAVGQPELLPYYHRADAFALPSFREGLPVVLMESMACEVPCVASRIAGIGELIIDGENGLIATAGRADQFASQLQRIAEDREFATTLGVRARQAVAAGFTTKHNIEGMIRFFERFADPST